MTAAIATDKGCYVSGHDRQLYLIDETTAQVTEFDDPLRNFGAFLSGGRVTYQRLDDAGEFELVLWHAHTGEIDVLATGETVSTPLRDSSWLAIASEDTLMVVTPDGQAAHDIAGVSGFHVTNDVLYLIQVTGEGTRLSARLVDELAP